MKKLIFIVALLLLSACGNDKKDSISGGGSQSDDFYAAAWCRMHGMRFAKMSSLIDGDLRYCVVSRTDIYTLSQASSLTIRQVDEH